MDPTQREAARHVAPQPYLPACLPERGRSTCVAAPPSSSSCSTTTLAHPRHRPASPHHVTTHPLTTPCNRTPYSLPRHPTALTPQGRYTLRSVGVVRAFGEGPDDAVTLASLQFQIGDYLDVAIHTGA